jgi:hypothetical protein
VSESRKARIKGRIGLVMLSLIYPILFGVPVALTVGLGAGLIVFVAVWAVVSFIAIGVLWTLGE